MFDCSSREEGKEEGGDWAALKKGGKDFVIFKVFGYFLMTARA